MKKVILTYGLIAGAIVSAMLLISIPLYDSGILKLDYGEVLGYTTMVIALSMIFFGIKSFRDNYQDGIISFGMGFKIGLLISVIASIMYALSWEVSYSKYGEQFTQKLSERHIEKMRAKGTTEAELQAEKQKMKEFVEWYKNPALRFGMTIMEILPIGVCFSLLGAAIMRKKEFLPAT